MFFSSMVNTPYFFSNARRARLEGEEELLPPFLAAPPLVKGLSLRADTVRAPSVGGMVVVVGVVVVVVFFMS
jgi:hypothetical protein